MSKSSDLPERCHKPTQLSTNRRLRGPGRPTRKNERNPLHFRTKYVLLRNSTTLTEAEDVNAMPASPPAPAARNADMLQELIESGMQLARAAAKKAVAMLTKTETDTATSGPGTPDPGQLFLRLWASIRQSITLQARLTTRPKAAPTPAPATTATTAPTTTAPTMNAATMTARERLTQELRTRKEAAKLGTTLSPLANLAMA